MRGSALAVLTPHLPTTLRAAGPLFSLREKTTRWASGGRAPEDEKGPRRDQRETQALGPGELLPEIEDREGREHRTARQYSKKAINQLAPITSHNGRSLNFRRPYQAKVMKTFEQQSSSTGMRRAESVAAGSRRDY